MENCLFCKIINKEIPAYMISQNDEFIAFLDISQASLGHTLVIPKKHYQDLYSIDNHTLANLHIFVKEVALMLKSKLNAQGINILNNNETLAGQTIFHYHVHIIPRYDTNDYVNFHLGINEKANLADIQAKILT